MLTKSDKIFIFFILQYLVAAFTSRYGPRCYGDGAWITFSDAHDALWREAKKEQ